MNIGFIGVGNMGAGMANNLIKAGHSLTINEIARERATPLLEQGAKWADTPKEVAEASEITFTSLPAPVDVEAMALGDEGILEGSKPGSVYIDLSSNSVSLVRRMHAVFETKGVHMLDAPVSGGVAGARSGRLAVMVGGDEAVYHRVKAVLDDFGDNVVYCGSIGSGSMVNSFSDPNSINPKTGGLIPVAILGSATFDVADLDDADVTTMFFGQCGNEGAVPKHDLTDAVTRAEHTEDIAGPGQGENLAPDGFDDLIVHFKSPKTSNLVDGDTEACLLSLGGQHIRGEDSIRISTGGGEGG